MLYVYDNAIVDDLNRSFNPIEAGNPVVSVVDPESVISLAAQIQDDKITFPLVAVNRNPDTPIDKLSSRNRPMTISRHFNILLF